jgi:hypothetical protein
MLSTRYSCKVLINIQFSQQVSEKYSYIRFNKNPTSGNGIVHADGRTDGQDETNCRFSQFCEMAYKPTNLFFIFSHIFYIFIYSEK